MKCSVSVDHRAYHLSLIHISTTLLFLPPQGSEDERTKVLALASRNICYIASSRIDKKGTTKLFLYDDSGRLENEDFDLYLFYLCRVRVLFISRDAFDDVMARYEAYRMRPDLVSVSYTHLDVYKRQSKCDNKPRT